MSTGRVLPITQRRSHRLRLTAGRKWLRTMLAWMLGCRSLSHTWKPPLTAIPAPCDGLTAPLKQRSEEHTSELQSQFHLVCRLLLEKKKKKLKHQHILNKKNK